MKLYIVGLGPGDLDYLAPRAKQILQDSQVIVGYTGYIDLIESLIENQTIISTGMKSEVERCQAAIQQARQGKTVSLVSSGDSGIYGMAGLIYQLAAPFPELSIEVIPGITAASSAASILGSPLTNDFAVISLSDLLTPWSTIERRLRACFQADMVVCLYNPSSQKRQDYLKRVIAIAKDYYPASTAAGFVRNAWRGKAGERFVGTLDELAHQSVDMFTTVILGNSQTKIIHDHLVTPRGYQV